MQQAVVWCKKAAEQGYAPAQGNLGVMYRNGHGVERNLNQAARWFQKAARQDTEHQAKARSELMKIYEEMKRGM
jgi:TPR repeat protein